MLESIKVIFFSDIGRSISFPQDSDLPYPQLFGKFCSKTLILYEKRLLSTLPFHQSILKGEIFKQQTYPIHYNAFFLKRGSYTPLLVDLTNCIDKLSVLVLCLCLIH